MKINQFLSQATGISRREAEKEVKDGKVTINGKVADFWQEVDSKKDTVVYNNEEITELKEHITIVLNKPKGYLTSRSDPEGRRIVMDLLPEKFKHLKPIGRLDFNSEGLLMLTDSGQKIFELTHPKFEKEKEYILKFLDHIDDLLIKRFKEGIYLKEGLAKVDRLEKISKNELKVIIHQGYNRQLRRMAEACGSKIIKLVRIRMGDIELEDLKLGNIRILE